MAGLREAGSMWNMLANLGRIAGRAVTALADLLLPATCAGCGDKAGAPGICPSCAGLLAVPAVATRPSPAPEGLPPCLTAGDYAGPLREVVLAYKERGRRSLNVPLGDVLAGIIRTGVTLGGTVDRLAQADEANAYHWDGTGWAKGDRAGTAAAGPTTRLALVAVPATATAVRERHGDHMLRLARRAARRLRRDGLRVTVATPLRALPKPDSAGLGRTARAIAARAAFRVRHDRMAQLRQDTLQREPAAVVLLDDVLTTGSTLAAVAGRLREHGVPVAFAATLAATRLRSSVRHKPARLRNPSATGTREGRDVAAQKS